MAMGWMDGWMDGCSTRGYPTLILILIFRAGEKSGCECPGLQFANAGFRFVCRQKDRLINMLLRPRKRSAEPFRSLLSFDSILLVRLRTLGLCVRVWRPLGSQFRHVVCLVRIWRLLGFAVLPPHLVLRPVSRECRVLLEHYPSEV